MKASILLFEAGYHKQNNIQENLVEVGGSFEQSYHPHLSARTFSDRIEDLPLQPPDFRNCAEPPASILIAMASSLPLQSIPRFLLPRRDILLRPHTRLLLQHATSLRYASTSGKGLSEEFRRRMAAQQQKATPVIPQPDKFRPPSHSARRPNRNLENKIYGPPISEEDKKRMATKKYPNMMSPEGTFSHWFLHNRSIHVWISLVFTTLHASIVKHEC